MINFPCQFCRAKIDSSRDHVRIPALPDKNGKVKRASSEYKCKACAAYYRLAFRPSGVIVLPLALAAAGLALLSRSPDVMELVGHKFGKHVFRPVVVTPPNNAFKPSPHRSFS